MTTDNNSLVNVHNAVVQNCSLPEFFSKGLRVDILRLDKIHPVISGNKWFKLKYYLQEALEKKCDSVLTFGGAWSNHIIATAYITKLYGLKSTGIIRGERPLILSQTLRAAIDFGMKLEFTSRESYARKNEDAFRKVVTEKFDNHYVIPEGGAGPTGIRGSKEILSLVDIKKYSHIICCMGTGTMYLGLANASLLHQEIIGIPVLKGINYLAGQFVENPQKINFCKILNEYHFGGYAKKTAELIRFMNNFYQQTGVPSDFVYTGKLLFACSDLVSKDYFPAGSNMLVIHSGGLQGNASLPKGTLLF